MPTNENLEDHADFAEVPPSEHDDTANGLSDSRRILLTHSHRLAVVDGREVWVSRRSGAWLPIEPVTQEVRATMAGLIDDARNYYGIDREANANDAKKAAADLSLISDRPPVGIITADRMAFDHPPHPLLLLKEGGAVDLDSGAIIAAEELPSFLISDGPGVTYRPELVARYAARLPGSLGPLRAAHLRPARQAFAGHR